jgi:8-oxo-dGTP diphosphatase
MASTDDPRPRIDVMVDVVALALVDGVLRVLLVRRGTPPFQGRWALPGGYLEVDEDLAPAAARELGEETGVVLEPGSLRQLGAYGDPGRDPRGRAVSVAFLAELNEEAAAQGGSDADEARWQPVSPLVGDGDGQDSLAFDHALILRDGVAASRWASVASPHADAG